MGRAMVVVAAAGQGTRMGKGVNKQLLLLAGKPVLAHTLAVLEASPGIAGIVLVVSPDEVARFHTLAKREWGYKKVLKVVAGGITRQESVWQGLLALPADTELVVVHDGARPLIQRNQIAAVIEAAACWGAATLAVPVKDTIKEVSPTGFISRTLCREFLWAVQTPQAFLYSLLVEAHRRAAETGAVATDDATLVEALGYQVKLIEGSYTNIKITTPEDLVVAELLLQMRES